jgi:hypothetical protein
MKTIKGPPLLWYTCFVLAVVLGYLPQNPHVSDSIPALLNIKADSKTCSDITNYQSTHLLLSICKQKPTSTSNKFCNKKTFLVYITLLLLANSNDVQLNPGPPLNDSTVYPCGTCDQPVTWDHRAVVCDTCDQWYHLNCQDVHSRTYSILNEDSAIRWDCLICNNPNYSTLCFDLHSLSTSNPFELLSLSSTSLQSPKTQLKPLHSSTPERSANPKKKPPKKLPLRILNVNCQSIKKKQDRIENLIESTKPDIIIATETWLDPSITDNQVFPDNFKLWRNDRKTGTGGGVLIAVKDSILSTDIPELQTDCELVWAKVNIV